MWMGTGRVHDDDDDDSGSNVSSSSKVSTRACGKNRPVTLPLKVRYDRYKF